MKEIIRRVNSQERLFEIINTMPKPKVSFTTFNVDGEGNGVPSVTVNAINNGGVCKYIYNHSGLIGINDLVNKLREHLDIYIKGVE